MRKEHFYKTAYLESAKVYCSILAFDESTNNYLVNFGFSDVWINGEELSKFCL